MTFSSQVGDNEPGECLASPEPRGLTGEPSAKAIFSLVARRPDAGTFCHPKACAIEAFPDFFSSMKVGFWK